MSIELNDAELVLQIGTGSRDAEAELFRRMAPRVRLYGLRHLRDEAAADDLTQMVLMTTIEALRAGRLREPGKLAHFVLGTCRMTVMDQRRGAQRKERILERFGADLVKPPAMSTPDLDHDSSGAVCASVSTVVVMTFYDEQTGADVANLWVFPNPTCVSFAIGRYTVEMHGERRMNCTKPIDPAVRRLLARSDGYLEAVEEHLLDCDDCGQRLREMIALAEGVRNLAQGSLRMIVSDVFLQRAAEAGNAVRILRSPEAG
jgi:RNA polymerase sigma-70 factor (ECF subfamily)